MKVIKNSDWYLMPGGKRALLRFPSDEELSELLTIPDVRRATHADVVSMNAGAPYPWGFMPENDTPTKLWKDKLIGYGGLVHDAWFLLDNGERIGGAPNVPETGPGAMRHYLLTTGGVDNSHQLNDNEGYAMVCENLPAINEKIYRIIHAHVAKHVTADRGGVVISPISTEGEVVYVGFVGRCMSCPNLERISIEALKAACPTLNIELHPDWKDWSL